jgi:hypothetical protein
MDWAKVPMKHKAKKGYYVAFREVFLRWNPVKMRESEGKIREVGMTFEEIEAQKYRNSCLFHDCIDRKCHHQRCCIGKSIMCILFLAV